jgi:hypothetical protein
MHYTSLTEVDNVAWQTHSRNYCHYSIKRINHYINNFVRSLAL